MSDMQPDLSTRDRIIHAADERAVEAYNRRLGELRGVSNTGLPEDNERSDLLREGFSYGSDHGRAMAAPVTESPLPAPPLPYEGLEAIAVARARDLQLVSRYAASLEAERDALGIEGATLLSRALKAEAERDAMRAALTEIRDSFDGYCIGSRASECPGPDAPFVDMLTCRACDAVQTARRALGGNDA